MKGQIFLEQLLADLFRTSPKNFPFKTFSTERWRALDNVFSEIKSRLAMPDVARFYGLEMNRASMACCPFHDDKTPSLKVYDDHFYCFGCGATGDQTGFVAKLYEANKFASAAADRRGKKDQRGFWIGAV